MRLRRYIPLLFILIGIGLLLYPTVKDQIEIRHQQQLLESWQTDMSRLEAIDTVADSNHTVAKAPQTKSSNNEQPTEHKLTQPALQGVEGELMIPKIDLKLPILTGASQQNLALSVASIDHTGKAGQIGNYAVAGHRSRKYGKNFNRLDELQIGDIVEVNDGKTTYTYVLDHKQVVEPTQVDVLKSDGRTRAITLLTCTLDGTQRIVLYGTLKTPSH